MSQAISSSYNMMTAMPFLTDTEILIDAHKHLLPHHNMSVIQFLKFSLPIVTTSNNLGNRQQS